LTAVPRQAGEPNLRFVVYWRQADWGFYGRRNEALARSLAAHPAVRDVLHLECVSLRGLLATALRAVAARDRGMRTAYWRQLRKAVARRPVTVAPGLRVKSLRVLGFTGPALVVRLNRWWLRRQLAPLQHPAPTALLCYPPAPYQDEVADSIPASSLLADLVDDVPAQERDPVRRRRKAAAFVALLPRCGAVFATSQRLAERYGDAAPSGIEFLPNGVRTDGAEPAPSSRRGGRRPRVGYAGTFNATLDQGLLEHLLAWNPNVDFVLIGPAAGAAAGFLRRMQERYGNCRYLGRKQHDELREHLAGCDVLVNLKRADEITRGNDSLKIYEYLATGKPVVSTPMAPADRLRDVVYTATHAPDFQQALRRALEENDPALVARRRVVAADNGWDRRAARIVARVQGLAAPLDGRRERVV